MLSRSHRAVAYVIRPDGRLLVNVHADDVWPWAHAGLQVPGGGVEPGETPQDAVLRETFEESGLTDVDVVGHLGTMDWDYRPYRDMVATRHFFHLRAHEPLQEEWEHWERGGPQEPPRLDGGVRLRHHWLPIERCHALSGGLSAMLGRLTESMRTTT